MNMIEKVARAINEAGFKLTGMKEIPWDDLNNTKKLAVIGLTKAAILAMREPTDEMIDAGLNRPIGVKIWSAMIDAALKE